MFTKEVEIKVAASTEGKPQVRFFYRIPTFDRSGNRIANHAETHIYHNVSKRSLERLRRVMNAHDLALYCGHTWLVVGYTRRV